MKILIASDSFKGSFSSLQVSNSIERGIKQIIPDAQITKVLVADGGEGTLEAIVTSVNGFYNEVEVLNPLGNSIIAKYGVINNDTAIIEMAQASGIMLLNDTQLKPLHTSTYGTGQLINDALNKGFRNIYIGLGGSATNDGGVGMAMALGVKFYDKDNNGIIFGNIGLAHIDSIDISNINPLIYDSEIVVLSDVNNPLYGEKGAAYVFGPQKGASIDEVKIIDNNLKHYANKLNEFLQIDVSNIPGSGAAGGLGAGLIAFCKAKVESGADKILEIIGLEKYIIGVDLVITGEGKIDGQTIYGKTPIKVSELAKKHNVFTLAIVGSIGEDADKVYEYGINMIASIRDKDMSLEYAILNVDCLIERVTIKAIKTLLENKKLNLS